jgi:hypothetical protein
MRYIATGLLFFTLFVSVPIAQAHGEEGHADFSDIQPLIEERVDCATLSDEQLERIGDYFMEQMHPGEAHVAMDVMMGGEGSSQLTTMHISMARRLYCGDEQTPMGMMAGGMMGMMQGMGGMMGQMNETGAMEQVGAPEMMSATTPYQFVLPGVLFLLAGVALGVVFARRKQ